MVPVAAVVVPEGGAWQRGGFGGRYSLSLCEGRVGMTRACQTRNKYM